MAPKSLRRPRVVVAILALLGLGAADLALAAAAPDSTLGALAALACGTAMAALFFSVWEWTLHRYLYHRDQGPILRPIFLAHHRDHHLLAFPVWRFTAETGDDGTKGAHPSVWTPVLTAILGRRVVVSDRLLYVFLGLGLVGGSGVWATGRPIFVVGVVLAGVLINYLFSHVHSAIHHPGSHPHLERQPWFPFLARHHYLHHVDTECNENFLLPLPDLLFGTLRLAITDRELARVRAGAPPHGEGLAHAE